jgi:hypothetical protein
MIIRAGHPGSELYPRGDVIEQRRQNRFDERWLRRLEHGHEPGANRRRNCLQGSDKVE